MGGAGDRPPPASQQQLSKAPDPVLEGSVQDGSVPDALREPTELKESILHLECKNPQFTPSSLAAEAHPRVSSALVLLLSPINSASSSSTSAALPTPEVVPSLQTASSPNAPRSAKRLRLSPVLSDWELGQ